MLNRCLRTLITALLVVLPACGRGDTPVISGSPPAVDPTPATPSLVTATEHPDGENGNSVPDAGSGALITGNAVGPVELGVAGDALAGDLGPDYTVTGPHTDIFVDQVLYEVSRDGEVHLYAGWLNGEPPTISLIVTENTLYRTAEGIGAGSTIDEAAQAYGNPTLNYSFSDEGREYAEFPTAPSPRMSFRVGNIGELSGIYSTEDEFNETNEWRAGATIQYVLIHN